jgi:hypothetical protein
MKQQASKQNNNPVNPNYQHFQKYSILPQFSYHNNNMSSYSNQTPMALDIVQQRQYQCLCIVLQAVNETCKRMGDNSTSFGSTCSDAPLTDFQKALCKLAQTLDSEKGGNCVTALAVLKGLRGPEFVFASNSRKVPELETTKVFLSELIEYVGSYADKSLDKNATKAVQKQVLTRILKFNFPRLEEYLKGLNAALECCIAFCEDPQQPSSKYTPRYNL